MADLEFAPCMACMLKLKSEKLNPSAWSRIFTCLFGLAIAAGPREYQSR
jgi:hypothetical protein